ncbi:MAG: IS1595 family transposase [Gemmatimonadaceae bacterium]
MGGRRKGVKGRPMRCDKDHTPVVGIVQRRGKAKAFAIERCDGATLIGHAMRHIEPNAIVYTDQHPSYHGLRYTVMAFDHRIIRHDGDTWVHGDKHTNNVEGLWSLIKRGINGSYRHVSKKYLQHYLNEYCFRQNTRNDERPTFLSFLDRIAVAKPS